MHLGDGCVVVLSGIATSGESQWSASTLLNGATSKHGKRPAAMELAAISLDLDDILWPIQPVIERVDQCPA